MEVWKDIKGYEGFYQVSDGGRIKSLSRMVNTKGNSKRQIGNVVMNHYLDCYGVPFVMLSKDKRVRRFRVARIVASAFIGEPKGRMEVSHKNGDQLDCSADNLEWVSRIENARRKRNGK